MIETYCLVAIWHFLIWLLCVA